MKKFCIVLSLILISLFTTAYDFNGESINIPLPEDFIFYDCGIDTPTQRSHVSPYQCWSVEYSLNGCSANYPGSSCEKHLKNAINRYCSNYDGVSESLLEFNNISDEYYPCYGGAMSQDLVQIGDIVKCNLDTDEYFFMLITDVKNNEHTSDELDTNQVQCKYGHGYIVSDWSVQLSICEFVVNNKIESSAISYSSDTTFEGRSVVSIQIVDNVNLD